MPYLTVQGSRFYYEETGPSDGRPLLLLHAALQTGEAMAPLITRMHKEGFRMIAPDMRGHGRTANPGRALSIGLLADDMAALMAELGLERPLLAGYSLGGIVGIELARRGLVSRLVVLAARIRPAPQARVTFDPARIRSRSPVWATWLDKVHGEQNWGELAGELGVLLQDWEGFAPEALAAITCPVLVVQGDRDELVPVSQARELAALVPGALLREVPRAQHPDLLYRPDAMRAVADFLITAS